VSISHEDFFSCAGEPRTEEHKLPDGKTILVSEMGGDEWTEVQAETMRARLLNNGKDPFLDARVIVRSCMDADKKPIFFRPILSGDKDHDKAELAKYQEQLQKIMKRPVRVFQPLMDRVNRVNFADEESYEALKKKSATAASDGSSSSPETPDTSTSEA